MQQHPAFSEPRFCGSAMAERLEQVNIATRSLRLNGIRPTGFDLNLGGSRPRIHIDGHDAQRVRHEIGSVMAVRRDDTFHMTAIFCEVDLIWTQEVPHG